MDKVRTNRCYKLPAKNLDSFYAIILVVHLVVNVSNFYRRNGLSISVPYTILGIKSTLDDATLIVSNYINKEVLKDQAVQSDDVRRIEKIYDTESKILESATACKFREDNPEMELLINSLSNGSN